MSVKVGPRARFQLKEVKTMKGKVKVELKKAIEFAQAGFDIECYVLLSNANAPSRRNPKRRRETIPESRPTRC